MHTEIGKYTGGKTIQSFIYAANGSKMTITTQKWDLGIIVDDSMKTLAWYTAVVRKSNRMIL